MNCKYCNNNEVTILDILVHNEKICLYCVNERNLREFNKHKQKKLGLEKQSSKVKEF